MSGANTEYEITIINWQKYQKPNTSKFIALHLKLLHDPTMFELTVEQRWVWIALLLHAGSYGAAFTLRANYMRIAFGLRRGWRHIEDMRALKINGLIDVNVPIREENIGYERIGEESDQPKKPAAPAAKNKQELIVVPDSISPEAWEAAIQHRKELRLKPLTPTGTKKRINHWSKFSIDIQLAAVEESIRNNWQGVFPEKINPNGGYKTDMDHNREAIQRWLDESTRDDEEAGVRESDGEGLPRLPSQTTG